MDTLATTHIPEPPFFDPQALRVELTALFHASGNQSAAAGSPVLARLKELVKLARASARARLEVDGNGRRCASALSQFQDLVGGWNGTGQTKRGSIVGAWREKGDWRWKFEGNLIALEYRVEEGKLLTSAWLTFDPAN